MKTIPLTLTMLCLAACSSQPPFATTTGVLSPDSTMTVSALRSDINIYKPAANQPSNVFTVAATVAAGHAVPEPPSVRRAGTGVVVFATKPLERLLVRVPDRVNIVVDDRSGNISVTDITGNADVTTRSGDIRIMVPGYAQAQTGRGSMAVTFGATQWRGTLHFDDGAGDVEIYVLATAKFHVRMHTDNGTLFTDFPLKGTSQGSSETIDGSVNGGSAQGLDIEDKRGTIRLLRLTPQA